MIHLQYIKTWCKLQFTFYLLKIKYAYFYIWWLNCKTKGNSVIYIYVIYMNNEIMVDEFCLQINVNIYDSCIFHRIKIIYFAIYLQFQLRHGDTLIKTFCFQLKTVYLNNWKQIIWNWMKNYSICKCPFHSLMFKFFKCLS